MILRVLRFGFATPTEISVFAVVYATVISALFFRDLTWKRFEESGIAGALLGETTKELWPFFIAGMLVLLAISDIPALTIYGVHNNGCPRHMTGASSNRK